MTKALEASVVRLGPSGTVRCALGWRLDEAWSGRLADYDLWFVWSGRGVMQLHSGPLSLEPGICVLMRPGGRYVTEQDPARRLGVTYIHFSLHDQTGKPHKELALPPEVTRFEDITYVDAVSRRVVGSPWVGASDAPAVRETLLKGLLLDLAARHVRRPMQMSRPIPPEHHEVLALAARIAEDPASAEPVAKLADRLGWSSDHFSRVFRALVGRSPSGFVIAARIERAKLMLVESAAPLKQIARSVGYTDLAYFSRHFKSVTGQTPSRYRGTFDSPAPREDFTKPK